MTKFAAAYEGVELILDATDAAAARAEVVDGLKQGYSWDEGQTGFDASATLITLDRELAGEEEAEDEIEIDGVWYAVSDRAIVETYVQSPFEVALETAGVLMEDEREFSTDQVIRVGDELYYREQNGGSRGAWQPHSGPMGDWDAPREVRLIDEPEAKRLMLEWGASPAKVAALIA